MNDSRYRAGDVLRDIDHNPDWHVATIIQHVEHAAHLADDLLVTAKGGPGYQMSTRHEREFRNPPHIRDGGPPSPLQHGDAPYRGPYHRRNSRVHWANEQSLPEYSDDEDESFRFDDDSNPMHVRSTRAHPQSGHPPHEPKAEGKGHEQTKNEWLKEQDCVAFAVTGVCPEQDSCRMRHRSGASITKGLEKKKPGGRGNGSTKGGKGGKGSKGGKGGKGGKGPPPPCYQYRSEGGCAYGDDCRFSHGQEKAMHMRIRDTKVQPPPPAHAPEPVPADTRAAPTRAPQATPTDDHAHAAPPPSGDRPHGRACPSPRQLGPTMLTLRAHPARVAATDLGQIATNPHTPAPCAPMLTASGGSRQAPVAPPRPHSPSTWLPEITPNIEAYAENINFDTAADVGLTSNYSLLHQPRACHQVIQGIGDTRVVYTHEGLVIIQPKRHGPVVSIRTLFKPGPPLTQLRRESGPARSEGPFHQRECPW